MFLRGSRLVWWFCRPVACQNALLSECTANRQQCGAWCWINHVNQPMTSITRHLDSVITGRRVTLGHLFRFIHRLNIFYIDLKFCEFVCIFMSLSVLEKRPCRSIKIHQIWHDNRPLGARSRLKNSVIPTKIHRQSLYSRGSSVGL